MSKESNCCLDTQQVKAILEEIKNKTKRKAYRLTINPEKKPGIFDSKFGGVPYWDESKEYPVDAAGDKMLLLAQVNLQGLERLSNQDGLELPSQGMLQFFCGADDCYGLDFDEADSQKSYRVIYHETIDDTVTEEKVRALGVPVSTDENMEEFTPVFLPAVVDISVEELCLSFGDYRFEEMFRQLAQEKYQVDTKDAALYKLLSDEDYNTVTEEVNFNGHWLLGYPFFTQEDPRGYTEELRRYDIMLFQMDSEMKDREDYVLWGDCGVGNFFISREDLKKREFGSTLYNWDCC